MIRKENLHRKRVVQNAEEMTVNLKNGEYSFESFKIPHSDGIFCEITILDRIVRLMVDANGYFSLKVGDLRTMKMKIIDQGNVRFKGYVFPHDLGKEADPKQWDANFRPGNKAGEINRLKKKGNNNAKRKTASKSTSKKKANPKRFKQAELSFNGR